MYKYFTFEEEARRNQIKGRVLITLEFDKIVNELIGYARTSFGKKLAAEIVPTTDSSLIVLTRHIHTLISMETFHLAVSRILVHIYHMAKLAVV